MQKLNVVVGGHHGSVVVDVSALDGGLDVFVGTADDHVDLGRWHVLLASHVLMVQMDASDDLE